MFMISEWLENFLGWWREDEVKRDPESDFLPLTVLRKLARERHGGVICDLMSDTDLREWYKSDRYNILSDSQLWREESESE